MRVLWILLLSVGLLPRGTAQPLGVGDTLPEALVGNVLNHSAPFLRLSELRGKLVLLDFWSTNCTGCIRAFPKVDSLQKKFSDQLQILLVNRHSRDSTGRFFAQRPRIRMPGVPLVTGDTLLGRWFPHGLFPHHVWIDPGGKVLAITDGSSATEANIRQMLKGRRVDMNEKKDRTSYNLDKPLLLTDSALLFTPKSCYSSIAPGIRNLPGLTSYQRVGGSKKMNRILLTRASAERLYQVAFSEGGTYPFLQHNTVQLRVKDPERFRPPEDAGRRSAWEREQVWSYDVQVPPAMADRIFKFMQQDLVRYFGARARIRYQKVPCLVLRQKGRGPDLHTQGGEPALVHNDTLWGFRNQPFSLLAGRLRMVFMGLPAPFVDATGIDYAVDMDLHLEGTDWRSIARALEPYGLQLREEPCRQPVLVITDP